MSVEIKRPCAAVSLVWWGDQEDDGRFLCVWNPRYRGWSLPGGKVEEGETPEQAQARELEEETGMLTESRELVYEGPALTDAIERIEGRGRYVYVFKVKAIGEPRQMEERSPVRWMTVEDFLLNTPFFAFYRKALARICGGPVAEMIVNMLSGVSDMLVRDEHWNALGRHALSMVLSMDPKKCAPGLVQIHEKAAELEKRFYESPEAAKQARTARLLFAKFDEHVHPPAEMEERLLEVVSRSGGTSGARLPEGGGVVIGPGREVLHVRGSNKKVVIRGAGGQPGTADGPGANGWITIEVLDDGGED